MSNGPESPLCPECGGEMVQKTSGRSKRPFWSCKLWPQCDGTAPLYETYESPTKKRKLDEFREYAAVEIFKTLLAHPENRKYLWERYVIDRSECRLAVELADDLAKELERE